MSLSIVLFSNSSLYCMDNEIKAQNSFLGKKTKCEHKKEDIETLYIKMIKKMQNSITMFHFILVK